MKVKVYTTPSCPYCFALKEYLKENNISFEEIDLSKDSKAKEMIIKKTNQIGVPVIEIDGEFITGFDKEKLKEILTKKE